MQTEEFHRCVVQMAPEARIVVPTTRQALIAVKTARRVLIVAETTRRVHTAAPTDLCDLIAILLESSLMLDHR